MRLGVRPQMMFSVIHLVLVVNLALVVTLAFVVNLVVWATLGVSVV